MHIKDRGTFSSADDQPARYCSYNSTISGSGALARCRGDADEGDNRPHWNLVDAAATSTAIWRAERRRFGMIWWPVFPMGFSEAFGNNALPIHQLVAAGWLPPDAELLPASSWFDYWYQPFSSRPLDTMQRLEQRADTRCYRQLAVCKLASFVFDHTFQTERNGWRPWSAMQSVVDGIPELRGEARRLAEAWRRPSLMLPVGDGSSLASELSVVFVDRPGRRKLENAAVLAQSLDGTRVLGTRVAATTHRFGLRGFADDVRRMRTADVLVGPHGADLLNGLLMHAGASLVEIRGYLFTGALGTWSRWYEDMFAFEDIVHHYVHELGVQETVGAAQLQASAGRPLNAHNTWNLNMVLPEELLTRTLQEIVSAGSRPPRRAARGDDPHAHAKHKTHAERGESRSRGKAIM